MLELAKLAAVEKNRAENKVFRFVDELGEVDLITRI